MKDIDYYKSVLKKYFSGRKSPEGERIFQKWFHQPVAPSAEETSEEETQKIGSRIEKRLRSTIAADTMPSTNHSSTVVPLWKWYAAAATLLFGGLSFLFWANVASNSPSAIALDRNTSPVYIEKVNNSKSKIQITLPDGSVVQLNQNSKIRFPEKFASTRREVSLEGEAFFDVVRNTQSKFIVTSQKLQTIVLGTSFNIRAYAGQPTIEVRVTTGKVMVRDSVSKSLVTLLPKQRAVYEQLASVLRKDTTQVVFQREEFGNESEDVAGELIFEDLPLDIAVALLHQKFGVAIVIESNVMKNCKVKGSFKDKMVSEIIEVICLQTGCSYSVQQDQYTLRGNRCLVQ